MENQLLFEKKFFSINVLLWIRCRVGRKSVWAPFENMPFPQDIATHIPDTEDQIPLELFFK
jgi:hypothetical protein